MAEETDALAEARLAYSKALGIRDNVRRHPDPKGREREMVFMANATALAQVAALIAIAEALTEKKNER